jgi:L-2-hydroxyglutarate oxidase LhgO
MDEVDLLIIGAGVVGVAIAREAALAGRSVIVVEAHEAAGMETSSRNSEVIHAGIYYRQGSLKAQHCVAGRRLLYAYCAAHGVAHQRIGKLIVATNADEDAQLASIAARAAANGVTGDEALTVLSASEVVAMEPELHCTSALWSPSTGIVDSHSLIQTMIGEAEAAGALFVFGTEVDRLTTGSPHRISGLSRGEDFELTARQIVVAGGLQGPALMRRSGLADTVPADYWLKGNYFSLARKSPFRHLIYPVPVKGGLGVHATLDLAGAMRFGPDTEAVDSLDYRVDPARAAGFAGAIRRYWPEIAEADLVPAYAGIRPKLVSAPGEEGDFVIHGPAQTGAEGLFALYGIESPGLTSSLSLARAVAALL